ncbi:hypothetical protein [Rhizobium sp. AN80A]|uniref:hypothetical protein n=1 Tax=Rhizobium sp. AN80A TaxID=3040673 RepID=UPI0024B3ABC3|nr:hypothetical protein [Rhizobium sp. AN80A]
MFKALAAAIARLFKIGVSGLRWCENLVLSPFKAIFGGGGAMPNPEFTPTMTSTELLEEYDANRKAQATSQHSNRDSVECVVKYAGASPAARATTDLSAVPADARITLLTMDDLELKALANAGPAKVRKWLEGRNHGIFGVPTVTPVDTAKSATPVMPPRAVMTPQEQMIWRIQSQLGKPDHSKEFRLA